MKLVSWNLNGLEDREVDVRTESALFQILLGAPIEEAAQPGFKLNAPDIVVLQEVVDRTFLAHIKPHLTAAGLTMYPPELDERDSESSYFDLIAVRDKILETGYHKFPWTEQGRGVSFVKIKGLTILTSHMESMKAGTHQRIEQAGFIIELMQNSGPCIFAGDTNLRDEEWEAIDHGDVRDVWETLGSVKKHRMTWREGNARTRFDRVWVHQVEPELFETFGKNRIKQIRMRPSDHYGVRVEFKTPA